MWHDDCNTELEQDATFSLWPLIWIVAAIWAAIYGVALLIWGAA